MVETIIREKGTRGIRSRFMFSIGSSQNPQFDNIQGYIEHYGLDSILREVYDEDPENFDILTREYKKVLNAEPSNYFYKIRKVEEKYGILLTEHIYLFRLEEPVVINGQRFVDWDYSSGKFYIGDTWHFSNEEILNDIKEQPFISFVEKYKCFGM